MNSRTGPKEKGQLSTCVRKGRHGASFVTEFLASSWRDRRRHRKADALQLALGPRAGRVGRASDPQLRRAPRSDRHVLGPVVEEGEGQVLHPQAARAAASRLSWKGRALRK